MKKIAATVFPMVLLVLLAGNSYSQESLYKRLGGYDAIAAVTDDFIGRLVTDKGLSRFFVGLATTAKQKFASTWWIFFVTKAEGPALIWAAP